jgi:hypothetical protein
MKNLQTIILWTLRKISNNFPYKTEKETIRFCLINLTIEVFEAFNKKNVLENWIGIGMVSIYPDLIFLEWIVTKRF